MLAPLAGDFLIKMEEYCSITARISLKKIVKGRALSRHKLEFKIIYRLNEGLCGLAETKADIENQLEEHYDLAGCKN